MRLTINGETVEYTLEHEKTLGDIVAGVRRWLAAEGFHITALREGPTDLLPLPAGSWEGRDIGSVDCLHVEAIHTGDMKVAHWKAIRAWLGALLDEIEHPSSATADTDPLTELLDGLSGTLDGMATNPFVSPGSDTLRLFTALWAGQDARAVRAWSAERAASAAAVTRELAAAADTRIADAADPQEALAGRRARLQASMGKLPEVSLLLQTGRDREAMAIIVDFTDTMQSLADILPFLGPDEERARLFAELTPPMRDLIAAFTNRDSVLIGDLLEYEVTPRLGRLLPKLGGTA